MKKKLCVCVMTGMMMGVLFGCGASKSDNSTTTEITTEDNSEKIKDALEQADNLAEDGRFMDATNKLENFKGDSDVDECLEQLKTDAIALAAIKSFYEASYEIDYSTASYVKDVSTFSVKEMKLYKAVPIEGAKYIDEAQIGRADNRNPLERFENARKEWEKNKSILALLTCSYDNEDCYILFVGNEEKMELYGITNTLMIKSANFNSQYFTQGIRYDRPEYLIASWAFSQCEMAYTEIGTPDISRINRIVSKGKGTVTGIQIIK